MITYELINTTSHAIDTQALERGLKRAEAQLGDIGDRTVSIEVVSSAESERLNRLLRGVDAPTDCISVSTQESHVGDQIIEETANGGIHLRVSQAKNLEHAWPHLGQLILCYDVIQRNAAQARQDTNRELEWVVEHGILHVMGFHHDHDS